VGGGGEWKRIEMNGLRGWANEERYGRKYFENGGGYCCLSSEPVTILSDGKTSTTVVGSAQGDEVYRLIVRTLRIVTSSANSRLQRTAGRHLRHFYRALRAARSRKRKAVGRRNNPRVGIIPLIMTKVESIERAVETLTPEELAAFRAWFFEHDWNAWDREIERDSAEGRLDRFAAEALAEFDRDETTEL
jgi:hypothetical protein